MYQSKMQVLKNYLTNAHTEMLEDGEAGTDLPNKEQLKKIKKEANEMSFGLIKIAEEKKKEKEDKAPSLAKHVAGGAAAGTAGGLASTYVSGRPKALENTKMEIRSQGSKAAVDAMHEVNKSSRNATPYTKLEEAANKAKAPFDKMLGDTKALRKTPEYAKELKGMGKFLTGAGAVGGAALGGLAYATSKKEHQKKQDEKAKKEKMLQPLFDEIDRQIAAGK